MESYIYYAHTIVIEVVSMNSDKAINVLKEVLKIFASVSIEKDAGTSEQDQYTLSVYTITFYQKDLVKVKALAKKLNLEYIIENGTLTIFEEEEKVKTQ